MPGLIRSALFRTTLYIVLMFAVAVSGYYIIPASVVYSVEEKYVFESVSDPAAVALGVLLPKSGPYQTVDKLQIDWTGYRQVQDEGRVNVIQLEGELTRESCQTAVISYEVVLKQGAVRWDGPEDDYLVRPQPEVESDDIALVAKSDDLARGSSLKSARSIYSFVSGYLDWPTETRVGDGQSALAAYQTGVGGCGEFANLMVALCRAAGIPAQTVSGIAFPEMVPFTEQSSVWNHPGGAHAWVEFSTDAGWEIADPSWGSGLGGWMRPLYFGRSDGMHLAYAEAGEEQRIYESMVNWAAETGEMIGGMSTPLKFAATASSPGVKMTPGASVRKGWDGRWFDMFGLILLAAVPMRLLEQRLKKKS